MNVDNKKTRPTRKHDHNKWWITIKFLEFVKPAVHHKTEGGHGNFRERNGQAHYLHKNYEQSMHTAGPEKRTL